MIDPLISKCVILPLVTCVISMRISANCLMQLCHLTVIFDLEIQYTIGHVECSINLFHINSMRDGSILELYNYVC